MKKGKRGREGEREKKRSDAGPAGDFKTWSRKKQLVQDLCIVSKLLEN